MVFTPDQDAFILMAHFRSGIRNIDGTWTYSLSSCMEQFAQAYPDVVVDRETFEQHKRRLVKRFETKNCICKGKSPGRKTVLTDEVIDDMKKIIKESPNSSLSKLSRETGVSASTCRKARKNKFV